MGDLRWAYPASLDELRQCLHDGARLHGGGTGILRRPPTTGTLACLSHAGLDDTVATGSTIRFGAAVTFAEALEVARGAGGQQLLGLALSTAASPGLRNRITLGGSIAMFPPWSSLVGPLLALEARVHLIGAHEGVVGVGDYLERVELRRRTAVTAVEMDAGTGWSCSWFRFCRTRMTYPLFTVTVLTQRDGSSLRAARIVLTGCHGRYLRCRELEERLSTGVIPDEITPADLGTTFPDRQGFSGEYLTYRAGVEVLRGLGGAV